MRPVKLSMTAFGAYAKETVIDFDKLGTKGMYLITGDTGAGKSTIFDAISYALYGTASGNDREKNMLRSRYADEKTKTSVELVFEYKGKRYTITRGISDKTDKVKLEFPDGKMPIEKKTEADRAIERLLGISKDQFKQIVMLAQGDFRRMLFSNTDERREIFRKIFDTDLYNRFEEVIKGKAKQANADFESAKETAVSGVKFVKPVDGSPLAEAKQSIDDGGLPEISALGEFCKLLEAQNSSDGELKQELGKKRENVSKDHIALVRELENINKNNKTFNNRKAQSDSLLELKKRADESKNAAAEIKVSNGAEIDKLKSSITLINNSLGKYKELEKSRSELSSLEKAIEENTRERDDLETRISDLNKKLDALKKESETVKNAGTRLAELTAAKKEADSQKQELDALIKAVSELDKKEKDLKALQAAYQRACDETSRLDAEAKLLRRRFNDEQAGIIAESLADNMPCPVCGSVHHPKKAVKSQNAPSQADVEKAEKLSDAAKDAESKASAESGKANGEYEEAKKSVLASIEKLGLNCPLEDAKATAEARLARVKGTLETKEAEIKTEQANDARRQKLEKDIPEKTSEIDKLNAQFNELKTQLATDRAAANGKSERITEMSDSLDYGSESEAREAVRSLDSKAKALQSETDNAQANADRLSESVSKTKASIETLTKQLPPDYKLIDTDDKQTDLSALDDELKRLDEKIKAVEIRLTHNAELLKTLSSSIPDLGKKEKERDTLTKLSNAASGKGGSKAKLETFVQMEFFRDILKRANLHFKEMSNEQYEFVIKNVPTDKSRDHTLDLDVKDYYNGTTRDVKTLSGGESFIASLSLALGLSDTVQQNAGGIQLETMFVDEGFGSLDDETLAKAMNALTSLTETNRLIGIISHVDQVKREISKKIIVKKNNASGSTIKIEV